MKTINETSVFYEYLHEHVATCTMVCDATGLKQKNATRYKAELQKAYLLWEVDYKPCQITGFKAAYLTTNKDLIPTIDKKQLSLWEGGNDGI